MPDLTDAIVAKIMEQLPAAMAAASEIELAETRQAISEPWPPSSDNTGEADPHRRSGNLANGLQREQEATDNSVTEHLISTRAPSPSIYRDGEYSPASRGTPADINFGRGGFPGTAPRPYMSHMLTRVKANYAKTVAEYLHFGV